MTQVEMEDVPDGELSTGKIGGGDEAMRNGDITVMTDVTDVSSTSNLNDTQPENNCCRDKLSSYLDGIDLAHKNGMEHDTVKHSTAWATAGLLISSSCFKTSEGIQSIRDVYQSAVCQCVLGLDPKGKHTQY